MLYFKNVDLADAYHVSLRTVLNWIEAAKQGKLDVTLHTKDEKSYIANTARNITTIEKIVAERKKFRNTRGHKVVRPNPEFYSLYDGQQVIDIISSIDIAREVPHKYSYFDRGAKYWSEYTHRMDAEASYSNLIATRELLALNLAYINKIVESYARVNVIDIGVGDALPVKDFLNSLIEKNRLNRYIALDISSEMLALAKSNITQWFGDKVTYEGYKLDINYDRFNNVLAAEYFSTDDKVANIILMLGGTLENFRYPENALRIIHDSMTRNDVLICTGKLDTDNARQYFDFGGTEEAQRLFPQDEYIIKMLGIDEEFYDVEMGFDEKLRQRYIRIRLKMSLTLSFTFSGKEKTINLEKDETLLLWRAWHHSAEQISKQLDQASFKVLQTSQTGDGAFLLTLSRIKIGR